MRKKFQTFNDGVLFVCKVNSGKSDFGAVRNTTRKEEVEKLLKLDFCEMSKRDEDLDFAESNGRILSMKVKTRLRPEVNKNHKVLIGSLLYGMVKLDANRGKQEMYLYLEEERELE